MPTEATLPSVRPAMHPLAARRILRLALGTGLSLGFSQVIGWQLSFIAPILTMTILALPLPAFGLKKGVLFIFALLAPTFAAMSLLPLLHFARWSGVLLLALALFYSFYYTAKGGSAVMGIFMTLGLTLVVTIGSVTPEVLFILIEALAKGAVFGIGFVWIAHALMPDPAPDPNAAPRPLPVKSSPNLAEARRNAVRSLLIVLPLALLFLFMSGSASYTVVMIKVASMGQQASSDHSRTLGKSLLESTFWGGVAALLGWGLLSAWPSLLFYTLLVGLASLIFGRLIFSGTAVRPDFSKWSYALLTMLVILAPALLDSPGSAGAGAAIWSRLALFAVIALYGTVTVAVFDAFWPARD